MLEVLEQVASGGKRPWTAPAGSGEGGGGGGEAAGGAGGVPESSGGDGSAAGASVTGGGSMMSAAIPPLFADLIRRLTHSDPAARPSFTQARGEEYTLKKKPFKKPLKKTLLSCAAR